MDRCETRVLAWLHIACHGLAGAGCSGPEWGPGGEVDSVNVLKVKEIGFINCHLYLFL